MKKLSLWVLAALVFFALLAEKARSEATDRPRPAESAAPRASSSRTSGTAPTHGGRDYVLPDKRKEFGKCMDPLLAGIRVGKQNTKNLSSAVIALICERSTDA